MREMPEQMLPCLLALGVFAVLIHDKPDTEFVRNEWNSVALQLGSASFHVLIPDLHSAPEVLRPGKLTGETLREVFSRTLCSRNRMIPARYHSVIRPKAIVMGSSWGADMAAEVAALDDVVAVALVSPQTGASGAEHLRSLQNIQGLGPTGGHLQCDAGTYFFTESPKFCCNNPRIDLNGSTVLAKKLGCSKKSQLCGDILANFNENSQQIKFVRGPAANATQEQLDVLATAGRGDMEDESQKAELCPTGTVPVQGRGYMSFACDGHVIKERRYHCCNVNGQLHCSPSLVDATSMDPPCDCHQNDVAVALTKTSPLTDGKVLDLASAKQQIESAATGLDIQWIEADAGGHGVISNFELPLVEFAESARELFVHGGEL
eukprot:s236_g35.t1